MELSFCSFASGSSGNCCLIKSREGAILIDAGISTKKIHKSMDEVGVDRSEIKGVFVTHEHTDHVKGINVLTKQNPSWQVFASYGTGACIRNRMYNEEMLSCFDAGSAVDIGDMRVTSVKTSHDAADPVCYSVKCGNSKIFILTDTGFISQEAFLHMQSSDLIVLEANHEVNMLKVGPYPYSLKQRILGDKGHLSNEDAGKCLAEVMRSDNRYRKVFLAHLSSENNFPRLAAQTVTNILEENRFYIGKHLSLDVMRRDGISCVAEI